MSTVQSIERAFAVLRRLASGPAGVTELSDRTALPKSTVSRLLSTLEGLGAVEQVSIGGPYRVGPLLEEISVAVLPGRSLLAGARPHLIELMETTGEATGISIADGDDVYYLDQVESPNPVQVRDWTGERVPLHVVSSGLVLLAHAPAERIDEYLARPLASYTERTVVDPAAIRARLGKVRAQGYSWVHEEFAAGINSVAAPVRNEAGAVIAAVHAHGPAYRFPTRSAAARRAAETVAAASRISQSVASASSR